MKEGLKAIGLEVLKPGFYKKRDLGPCQVWTMELFAKIVNGL